MEKDSPKDKLKASSPHAAYLGTQGSSPDAAYLGHLLQKGNANTGVVIVFWHIHDI